MLAEQLPVKTASTRKTVKQQITAYWKKYLGRGNQRPVPISDAFWQSIAAQQKLLK